MRKINKGVIYGFVFGFIAFVGITYASQSITNINQTASTGDIITAAWVNDVNTKIRSITTSSGGNCPATRLTVSSTDTPNRSCSGDFPNGINLQILSPRGIGMINNTPILAQCINGRWTIVSFICQYGGGR